MAVPRLRDPTFGRRPRRAGRQGSRSLPRAARPAGGSDDAGRGTCRLRALLKLRRLAAPESPGARALVPARSGLENKKALRRQPQQAAQSRRDAAPSCDLATHFSSNDVRRKVNNWSLAAPLRGAVRSSRCAPGGCLPGGRHPLRWSVQGGTRRSQSRSTSEGPSGCRHMRPFAACPAGEELPLTTVRLPQFRITVSRLPLDPSLDCLSPSAQWRTSPRP